MLYDFFPFDRKSKEPLYLQLYKSMRDAVEDGRLTGGQKLPSIRQLSQDLKLSRTTIETAYQQLHVEGYIESKPQSGYFVAKDIKRLQKQPTISMPLSNTSQNQARIRFHLGTDCIDAAHTDIKLWRKHVKDILGRQDILSSYGDPQGERELREALSAYSHGARGVCVSPQDIVIGAGTQPLLYLLCGLIQKEVKQIAMEQPGFRQAQQAFEDCGINPVLLQADRDGICLEQLEQSGVQALWVSPSSRPNGRPIPMTRRLRLLEWAQSRGGLLIEDDYNGELRYRARPIPAWQSQDSQRVVYIGSFSKLLLPSVRIGYMILPPQLMQRYQERVHRYHQTASKVEQLALARYIQEGQLERQLRRLRKIYAEKSVRLIEAFQKEFGKEIELVLQEAALYLLVTVKNGMDSQALVDAALEQGVKVMPEKQEKDSFGQVKVGFAGISTQDIPEAVYLLRKAWKRGSPRNVQ